MLHISESIVLFQPFCGMHLRIVGVYKNNKPSDRLKRCK